METVENILFGYENTKSYYNFFKIIQFCIMSFLLFRMKSNAVFQLIS